MLKISIFPWMLRLSEISSPICKECSTHQWKKWGGSTVSQTELWITVISQWLYKTKFTILQQQQKVLHLWIFILVGRSMVKWLSPNILEPWWTRKWEKFHSFYTWTNRHKGASLLSVTLFLLLSCLWVPLYYLLRWMAEIVMGFEIWETLKEQPMWPTYLTDEKNKTLGKEVAFLRAQ